MTDSYVHWQATLFIVLDTSNGYPHENLGPAFRLQAASWARSRCGVVTPSVHSADSNGARDEDCGVPHASHSRFAVRSPIVCAFVFAFALSPPRRARVQSPAPGSPFAPFASRFARAPAGASKPKRKPTFATARQCARKPVRKLDGHFPRGIT